MKKVLLFLGLLAVSATQAQMSVTKSDGTPVTEGQVFSFNSLDYEDAYFGFLVHNNSSQTITARIECVNVINGTGAGMELCFGDVCLASVSPGHAYPSSAVAIAPGGTNSQFDHFLNTTPNNGGITDYIFKFYMEDAMGDPVGNSVTVTYRYDPNGLSTTAFNANATTAMVKSSIVENNLEIRASKNVQMELFDVNGKSVNRQNLSAGDHSIDVSRLSAGIYILSFNTESNQKSSVKIVKK